MYILKYVALSLSVHVFKDLHNGDVLVFVVLFPIFGSLYSIVYLSISIYLFSSFNLSISYLPKPIIVFKCKIYYGLCVLYSDLLS